MNDNAAESTESKQIWSLVPCTRSFSRFENDEVDRVSLIPGCIGAGGRDGFAFAKVRIYIRVDKNRQVANSFLNRGFYKSSFSNDSFCC